MLLLILLLAIVLSSGSGTFFLMAMAIGPQENYDWYQIFFILNIFITGLNICNVILLYGGN